MSYLEHFNLTEQPFRLTPDPGFVYWSKQHARAKAYMESTIWLADGFVVITGDIGSGKTTLLQSFLSELEEDVIYAVVSQTQLSPTQFLQAVLTEFGFKPFEKHKVELLDMLNMFLIEQYSNGKKVVLIVDEAQNLTTKVLEEIRMLSGIETHKEKVLRIILSGQPELRQTLDSPQLKQLVQRVRLRFHLGPLERREMQEYIQHRVNVAGGSGDELFDDDTYDEIFLYTGGIPRLINTLCDTALLCAFADEKQTVGFDDVRAAVSELNWETYPQMSGRYPQLHTAEDVQNATAQFEIRSEGESLGAHRFAGGRIVAGRSPDNELYIKSKFVSRHHVQFMIDQNGCMMQDLNSTNGVFVNGRKVKAMALRDGDTVNIGIHEIVYQDLRDSDDSQTGSSEILETGQHDTNDPELDEEFDSEENDDESAVS